jgi:carbamoyltransferase
MAGTRLAGLDLRLDFGPRRWRQLRELAAPLRATGDKDVLRAARLAASFQAYFTEIVLRLTRALHARGGSDNLAYAGGCALNSAANGRIVGASGFKALHVPCAPADDGNALGAALYERHVARGLPYAPRTMSPYLGSEPDRAELDHILDLSALPHERFTTPDALAARVAGLIAAGHVVGVMRGRAEFGPRALGNRSLLADARLPGMKQEINRLVKFREDYRPLAPAILHEHGPDWFEGYQASPYMERALPFKDAVKSRVPAVVHADGTGRLQSVTRELNPWLHALLSAFHAATGVPLVVNTSLNVMGKPIVHGVKDAIQLLYTTGLRHLVIGDVLLER